MNSAPKTRHLYLRLMHESAGVDGGLETLRDIVSSAPGVVRVKEIHPHPRGGYKIMLDVEIGPLDDMASHIQANGYLLVF